MRKAKRVTIFALTVVMLAVMTMPAVVNATFEMDLEPDGVIGLVPGYFVPTTVHLSGMNCDGSSHTLSVMVKLGEPKDLTFSVNDLTGTGTAGPTPEGITYTYTPDAGTETYNIEVMIKAEPGTEGNDYGIYYKDVQSERVRIASASVPATTIPEFATIAVPVAAILGLLFLFNYRKQNTRSGKKGGEKEKK